MLNFDYPSCSFDEVFHFALKWTPRAIVAGFAGYYSLGIAYHSGIMAAIDRIVIRILLHVVGYAGVGALMPTMQWYAAWAVRMTAAIIAAILYDLTQRICCTIFRILRDSCVKQQIGQGDVEGMNDA